MAAAAGDLTAARDHYQASLDIRVKLAAADPANTGWQRDLSISRTSSGTWRPMPGTRPPPATTTRPASTSPNGWPPPTRPTPDGSATCPSAGTSSGTWRPRPGTWPPPATTTRPPRHPARLAAADPANTGWQRDLSVSHNKLGDIAAAAGDLAAARDHYQASLDIAARLAAADPANTEWQRDLSVSHNKLGDIAAAAGDLAAARDHLPGQPRHRRPAGRRRPRQHRMAARPVRQPRQARGHRGRGRGPGRRPRRYQASLDIAERLAAADPANTGWQRDLSISRNKLATAEYNTGS